MGEIDLKADTRIGTRLAGRYRLEERIDSGGMATVYKARDETLGRDVAVKIMHPALAADPSFVHRFRAEATNAARLSHPNIVTVYDTAESVTGDDRVLFIVMELCGGMTLRSLLDRFGHLDPPTVRHVARGVAAALDHAHMKGIIHRDVKPENVILTPEGQVKVVDFGIAKALGPTATQITTDRPIGTIAYVAPEQINGTDVDGRVDIYALGAVTYEMLTGNPPFRGDTPQAVAASRMYSPVLSPGISPSLDGAVMRATAARPEDRYETPGEFARALGESGTPTFLMDTDHLPDVPAAPLPKHEPPPVPVTDILPMKHRVYRRARRRMRIGSAIALLLAIIGIVAYAVIPRPTVVPDLRAQSLADARQALKKEGLKVGEPSEVFSDVVDKGSIVRTEPPMNTAVKKGIVVDIFVSKGPQLFLVPPVANRSTDEAKAMMSGAGFSLVIGTEQYSETVAKGNVVSISPDIGRAKRGTAFTALISKGPPPVTVPSVVGKTAEQARTALQDADLGYAPADVYSDTVAVGVVIRSDPEGGASAPKGSPVTVFVSKGPRPFPMPNFVGLSLSNARTKAHAQGLVVRNEYAVPGSGKPSGQVQGQNPPAGTNVRKGTGIDLYYST